MKRKNLQTDKENLNENLFIAFRDLFLKGINEDNKLKIPVAKPGLIINLQNTMRRNETNLPHGLWGG